MAPDGTINIKMPGFIGPERAIYIMAGIEKIGYIEPHTRRVFMKVGQCRGCGRCCERLSCEHLEKEPGNNDVWRCDLGVMRPFLCCISEPRNIKECTSRYEEVL